MLKIDQTLYNYDLPPELVALTPADPADAARLLVYNTKDGSTTFDYFFNLAKHLPRDTLLVFNQTRVSPARITLQKPTGGKVVCLFLVNESPQDPQLIRVIVDRKVAVGDTLSLEGGAICIVVSQDKGSLFTCKLQFSRHELLELLERQGKTPLPPYLRQTSLSETNKRSTYQPLFAPETAGANAQELASVAAPTASLHFTPELMRSLDTHGVQKCFVQLEVGLGTFAPLTEEALREKKLHAEWYCIPKETATSLCQAELAKNPIVAVGTTVIRALESFTAVSGRGQQVDTYHNTTAFISPGHAFVYPNCMITNFHLPESSLMMLVEAFLQHKRAPHHLKEIYLQAIEQKFRFFSYGDGMLIV